VSRQEKTFARTISRNQGLQTKPQEKEHVNVATASQVECQSCFQAKSLDIHFHFQVLCLTPLV